MLEIKDCRKVAYIEEQNETAAQIVASIDGAVSADLVAASPMARLYVVTLADGTEVIKNKADAPILFAAHIHGSQADLEIQGTAAIPIYMIDYLRASQN